MKNLNKQTETNQPLNSIICKKHDKNCFARPKFPLNQKKKPFVVQNLHTAIDHKFTADNQEIRSLFPGLNRKKRSEAVEGMNLVSHALVEYCNYETNVIGYIDNKGKDVYFNHEALRTISGLPTRRYERAFHNLVKAGFIKSTQFRHIDKNGKYKSTASHKILSWRFYRFLSEYAIGWVKDAKKYLIKQIKTTYTSIAGSAQANFFKDKMTNLLTNNKTVKPSNFANAPRKLEDIMPKVLAPEITQAQIERESQEKQNEIRLVFEAKEMGDTREYSEILRDIRQRRANNIKS